MSNIFNKTVLYSSFEFGNFVESLFTETLNLKQFWICVKLGQVWPLKLDETVPIYLTLNKLHNFSLSGSLNSWIIFKKQSIQHSQYRR